MSAHYLNTHDAIGFARNWVVTHTKSGEDLARELLKQRYSREIAEVVFRSLGYVANPFLLQSLDGSKKRNALLAGTRPTTFVHAFGDEDIVNLDLPVVVIAWISSCEECKGSGYDPAFQGTWIVEEFSLCKACNGLGTEPVNSDQVDTAE